MRYGSPPSPNLSRPHGTPALEPADDVLPPVLAEPLLPLLLAGGADRVDLAQGAFALRSPGGGLRWRALGYALAAAMLLQLGSVLVQGALYGKQAQMYEQANLALFESVFGEQRVVDLRQQFDSLRAAQMASSDVIALLQRIDGQLSLPVQTAGLRLGKPGIQGRFGIEGIRNRLERLNGTLDIDSRPGDGTRAAVSIPLPTTLTKEAKSP